MSDANKPQLKILSLGAGVQSSTLLLMAIEGEIERPDYTIFSDTQWEPAAVYRHLDWLEEHASAAGIPMHRVTQGHLGVDVLTGKPEAWIPAFSVNLAGQPSMLKRQCTRNYKLRPIRRKARELMLAAGATTIEQWIGISLDEAMRMKPSGVKYVTNRWPLIDRRMTRLDCLNWLERHGYPRPPKSSCIGCPLHDLSYWRTLKATSCIGCPLHDLSYWRTLKATSPDEWAEAVTFDQAIRQSARFKEPVYLHASLVPLDQVDLSTPQDHGQLELFDLECEGLCGV